MTNEEYEAESERLTKAKKGYDLNRTICAAAIVFVGYSIFNNDGIHTTPWYITLILAVVAAVILGILIFDCFKIKGITKKIKELEERAPDTLEAEKTE